MPGGSRLLLTQDYIRAHKNANRIDELYNF